MAIQHTVTFRLVHPAGSREEEEFLTAGLTTLAAVPGVADFRVSRQTSAKNPHDWQFSMVFADQAAYDAYNAHPAHVAFVSSRWEREVADFLEADFVAR